MLTTKSKISFYLIIWGLALGGIFAASHTHAFYEHPEIKRREYRWQVEMLDSQSLEIKLTQKLENTASQALDFQYLFPLLPHATQERFFVDALGHDFEVLEGRARLTHLFEKAKATQDTLFFGLGAPPYEKLFASESITIEPGESLTLKLAFKTNLDYVNDIYFSEVFLQDQVPSDHFELSFSIATKEPIHHFFSNLFHEALFERYEHQLVMIFEQTNYQPSDNARFFWSHTQNPTLLYKTQGEVYHGHFPKREKHKPLEEVILMLDVSGSMNGNPWIRAKEYTNFVLERLGESTSLKVVLIDDEVRFFNADWSKNSYDFRRGLFKHLNTLKPLGKSNFEQAFKTISKESPWYGGDPQARAFMVITDTPNFIPYDSDIISAPVIALHFDRDHTDFDLLTHASGGFIQGLFKNPPKLIESEALWTKWNDWKRTIMTPQASLGEGLKDATPEVVPGGLKDFGPFIMSRRFDQYSAVYSPVAQFIPRLWAARRLAHMLKAAPYSPEAKQAMLSIAHRFGIARGVINPQSQLDQFTKDLENTPQNKIQRLIMELETLPAGDLKGGRMVREIPFYQEAGGQIWRSYDFHEKASPHTLIKIAPFSPAQQFLYERFAHLLALEFSIAPQVDFCTAVRCVSVRKGQRETSEISDRLFFKDYDPTHWANAYLSELVNKGLLQAEAGGRLHPDRAIDRGAFAHMLVGLRGNIEDYHVITKPFFIDVDSTNPHFKSIQYLAAQKVTKGYQKDQTFRPLQGLTRAEAIKMILALEGFDPDQCKAPSSKEDDLDLSESGGLNCSRLTQASPFSDISGWERSWVIEGHARGWIKGFSDGTFRPHAKLTKAEAAKLLLSR